MMRRATWGFVAAGLVLAAMAAAVVPQRWGLRTYDDFLRGTFDGVSISADGVLSLAPREDRLEGPTEDFFLSFLTTPEGESYLGTGHGGKVFRIGKEGKAELHFQTAEMDVTCLALDRKGVLYAGTSPNGKIYKITAKGQGTVFFDPAERYLWDLLALENGNLLAACGESGGVYEIGPQGEGRPVFKAPENHVLCLKLDRNGDIVAGTGGSGLVYRIARNGDKAAVIYETPFEEVRSLAFDLDGNIYAAAGGLVTRGRGEAISAPSPAAKGVDVSVSVSAAAPGAPAQATPLTAAPARSAALPAAAGREPGAVFRVAPDGLARRIWSSPDELVYALFWAEAEKKVYFGTGPKGRLYAVDREEKASLVIQKSSEQLSACVPVGTRIYLLANNPSGLSVLLPEQRLAGEYLSPVWDARLLASWGRIEWDAALPAGASLQLQSRSGNAVEPGPSWSEWSPPYQKPAGEQVLSPRARYLQFRSLLKAQSGRAAPTLAKVALNFLQTNVPPVVTRLDLLEPNEVLLKPIETDDVIWGLERRTAETAAGKDDLRFAAAKKAERQGYRTVVWEAEDENGDALSYAISVRRDGDKDWRLLEDRWTETLYAFQTSHLPDGVYVVKVAASDGTSNPPDRELRGERSSPAFIVDNTAPVVKNLQVTRDGGQLAVSFQVEEGFSTIREVRYLVRPDDWRAAFPEDGLADGKTESYKFRIKLPAGADNLLTVLVKDAVNNVAVVRQVF
jgi:hypothetical protein